MNKVIAFDIDGTLLSYGDVKFSKKTMEAFKKLKENGYIIILASGRDLITMQNLLKQFNKIDYFVGTNGSFVYDVQKKEILFENDFKYLEIKSIVNKFNLKLKNIFISNNKDAFIDYESTKEEKARSFLGIWKKFNKVKLKNMKNIDDLDKLFEKDNIKIFIIRNLDKKQKSEIANYLSNSMTNLVIKKETQTGLYIQNIDQNKYNAISNLANLKNIDISNLITFGDGWNDFEMIKFAKTGIAMKNSDSMLIKIADDVAPDVQEDGVYLKLKEMGII